jgi:putative sigma-54 modulation protein
MKIIIDSHNIHVTEAIETHVNTCIQKLEHMNQKTLEARVHLDRDHAGQALKKYKCSMHILLKGKDVFAEDSEKDLYVAIDLATKKTQQQLRKQHNLKIMQHR